MRDCFVQKTTVNVKSAMALPHSHTLYELYVLEEGSRTFYIESDEFTMNDNDLLLVPASVPHRTEGDSYTRYLVNFSYDYITERQKKIIDLFVRQKFSMTKDEAGRIFYLLNMLLDLQADNSRNTEQYKKEDFNTCFSFLLYAISKLKNFPTKKYAPVKGYHPRTKKIISYIQEHYAEKITLDMFCKMLFVSESALCASFKKDTDMTIIDYLLKTRLKQAENMLMRSHKKISQIAEDCGFSSQNYFNLIFTKHLKCSPSEYRKTRQVKPDFSGGGGVRN